MHSNAIVVHASEGELELQETQLLTRLIIDEKST